MFASQIQNLILDLLHSYFAGSLQAVKAKDELLGGKSCWSADEGMYFELCDALEEEVWKRNLFSPADPTLVLCGLLSTQTERLETIRTDGQFKKRGEGYKEDYFGINKYELNIAMGLKPENNTTLCRVTFEDAMNPAKKVNASVQDLFQRFDTLLSGFQGEDAGIKERFWRNNLHICFQNWQEQGCGKDSVEYQVLLLIWGCLSADQKKQARGEMRVFESILRELPTEEAAKADPALPQKTFTLFYRGEADLYRGVYHESLERAAKRRGTDQTDILEQELAAEMGYGMGRKPERSYKNYIREFTESEKDIMEENSKLDEKHRAIRDYKQQNHAFFERDELLYIAVKLDFSFCDMIEMLEYIGYCLKTRSGLQDGRLVSYFLIEENRRLKYKEDILRSLL